MIKLSENKTRKRLRITQCVLYLFQIFFCTMPYIQGVTTGSEYLQTYSVFDMISFWGGTIPNNAMGSALKTYLVFMPIFVIIPIIGFFFCALDKERNMKNIVSLLCCLFGVLSILLIVNRLLSLGSMLSLIVYLVLCFITTMAMFARITDNSKK